MIGHFHRPNCKCGIKKGEKRRCACGAKWAYTVDVGVDPKTGKRKQKKKSGFSTKAEAEKACALLIAELEGGLVVNESNITFKDYAIEWLKSYDDGTKKPGTIRIRKHEIARLSDYLDFVKIKSVTKKMYQDALDALADRGYAGNTLDGANSTGRMIFGKAVRDDLIKKDPTDGARVKRKLKTIEELEQEKELPKFMEKEDLVKFLKVAKDFGLDSDYEIFLTLAYSGMRVGELLALKIPDVSRTSNTISVTKTLYVEKCDVTQYQLVTPKTKKSKREIIMTDDVIDVICARANRSKKSKLKHGDNWHNGGFIFAQTKKLYGYPFLVQTVGLRMTRLIKIAGLDVSLTPHSLRHTHTSLLAEAGVGLVEIMDRLGHTDDDTTKQVYLHVTRDKKKEAPQKFAELLKGL